MMKHKFVEFLPDVLESGVIYVSIEYATSAHLCCCGCGEQVVTPISPVGWTLSFHGDSVSLDPSIGNWGFPCESHYWIEKNKILWSRKWSREQIEKGRKEERIAKEKYHSIVQDDSEIEVDTPSTALQNSGMGERILRRLKKLWS